MIESLIEKLSMGGYGGYVWCCYILWFLAFFGQVFWVKKQTKQLIQRMKEEQKWDLRSN